MLDKYHIIFVTDAILVDYDGMNWYAAQAIGFDYPMTEYQILINRDTLTRPETISTIVHEIIEANHMKTGMEYWPAHKLAAAAEQNADNLKEVEKYLDKIGFSC